MDPTMNHRRRPYRCAGDLLSYGDVRRLRSQGDSIPSMPGPLRRRLRPDKLTELPDHALVGVVRIPEMASSPGRAISKRVLFALAALFAAVFIVYLDRGGYRDVQDNELSFLDCLYYATVSLSTTGYGDITPFAPEARLINVLVITPLRVMFLIVLVGTTLEVLTERSR